MAWAWIISKFKRNKSTFLSPDALARANLRRKLTNTFDKKKSMGQNKEGVSSSHHWNKSFDIRTYQRQKDTLWLR